jgi:hypothetical protein
MSKLLNESKYEVNFKESPSINQGSIGEEFTDILPSTAAAKGYTDREGLPYKIRKS